MPTPEQQKKIDQVHKNFKKDLQALLDKYDATLDVHIEGDTYGIDFEAVRVDFVHQDMKSTKGHFLLSDIDLDM
jgi:hypothetical protein